MRLPPASYYHTLFWQFLPVAIVFYTAALVHAGLGIWALYERRQFRWKAIEPLQLVLGLSIPALIITHIVGARLGQALFGHEKLYPQVLYAFWVGLALQDMADVRGPDHRLGSWLHRALFLAADESILSNARRRFCSRRRCWCRRWRMLGFYQGGRNVVADSRQHRMAGGQSFATPGRHRRPNSKCWITSPIIS